MAEGCVLAVANQKGGVGKTTTALSLAAALARNGKEVLVLDMDPHVCASVHMALIPERRPRTLYHLLTARPEHQNGLWPALEEHPAGQSWSMVAGDQRLAELEADWHDRRRKGFVLKEALKEPKLRYDYIILDCPPQMGVLLVNALVATDWLIIPAQTDFLAVHGLKLLFDTLRLLNKALEKPVAYKAVATMHDKRVGACVRVLQLLREKMGTAMFETVIPMDTRLREASALGKVVYDVAPESRGAVAYAHLAQEVMSL